MPRRSVSLPSTTTRASKALRISQAFHEATALHRQARWDAAAERYRFVLKADSSHVGALNGLALLRSQQGKLDEALKLARRALAREPQSAILHNTLGQALLFSERHEEAIAEFEKALAIQPDLIQSRNNLGTALKAARRLEEALSQYHRVLETNPNLIETRYNIVNLLQELRRHGEAIPHCHKLIQLGPSHPESFAKLAGLWAELGNFVEAERALSQAIALAPRRPGFYLNLSGYKRFTANDRHLHAMEALAQEIARLPAIDQCDLHFALGKAYADLQQHNRSFRHLRAGNAVMRQLVEYNQTATLEGFSRMAVAFTPEVMREKAGLGNSSAAPIFILGMPRSGTTLVEQILASHPKVHGAGELMEFHHAVKSVILQGGNLTLHAEALAALTGEQLCQLGGRYLASVRAFAPAGQRITDKLPANFALAGLIHLALPAARIIHTSRNPIDTCLSCFSLRFLHAQNWSYDFAELGRYYRSYERLMKHWRTVLPDGVMLEVRYEDVVGNVEQQARRIIAHCGLEWDDACLTFYRTQRPITTASVTQVRQPIYRSSVDRWRPYAKMIQPLLEALELDLAEPEKCDGVS
jgi:tetratricopeptide (TPR) repeat protein